MISPYHGILFIAHVQIFFCIRVARSVTGVEEELLKSTEFACVHTHFIFRLVYDIEKFELDFSA